MEVLVCVGPLESVW